MKRKPMKSRAYEDEVDVVVLVPVWVSVTVEVEVGVEVVVEVEVEVGVEVVVGVVVEVEVESLDVVFESEDELLDPIEDRLVEPNG
jgi:hypothetical protein